MPYCPDCGAENEADAAYCGSCGARIEGEGPRSLPGPRAQRGLRWPIVGALLAVVALVAGAIALYVAVDGNGESPESPASVGGDNKAALAPSPTGPSGGEPAATSEPTLTPEPTASQAPTAVPPVSGYGVPEEAIAVYLQGYGLGYVGDCEFVELETDIGLYCSQVWEDRGDTIVYIVGLAFSEPDTWLLLMLRDGGWLVVDDALLELGGQELVPPWP